LRGTLSLTPPCLFSHHPPSRIPPMLPLSLVHTHGMAMLPLSLVHTHDMALGYRERDVEGGRGRRKGGKEGAIRNEVEH
jgi:hypothetical protein